MPDGVESADGRFRQDERGGNGAIGLRVLLVRSHYRKQYRAPGFPIGIALIASYLESKGVFVKIRDLAIFEDRESALDMDGKLCRAVSF
jgi:hypothetical protein